MKLSSASVLPFHLPLRRSVRSARGAMAWRESVLLLLTTESGAVGVGEAAPLAGFGGESPSAAGGALVRAAQRLMGRDPRELEALLDELEALEPTAPGARAAVDTALHDLAARGANLRVADVLAKGAKSHARRQVAVNALVFDSSPRAAAEEARRAVGEGFGTIKLKLGAHTLQDDCVRVAAVREAIGAAPKLRLDANGAWGETEASRALDRLADFEVEFVEQPVAAEDIAALARVRRRSPIPIAADEALRDDRSALDVLARCAADLLVLKPGALGGLRVANRIAAQARARGIEVVVTSSLDSVVGVTAALHLAAALDGPHASGLATGSLFAEDLAPSLPVRRGQLRLDATAGLGVEIDASALRRLATGMRQEIFA